MKTNQSRRSSFARALPICLLGLGAVLLPSGALAQSRHGGSAFKSHGSKVTTTTRVVTTVTTSSPRIIYDSPRCVPAPVVCAPVAERCVPPRQIVCEPRRVVCEPVRVVRPCEPVVVRRGYGETCGIFGIPGFSLGFSFHF